MRFLLCFPLPLLLILGSFVSIDAAPQSIFTPVPPWSTHKPRLKRSIDDSTSPADYDSFSLDELTKLLEETKKKAEKEKMEMDAANSTLNAKQTECDKAKEDYDKKKEEWDKWKDFNDWRNKSAEAQKAITATNKILPELNRIKLNLEKQFLEAKTKLENAEEDLKDIENLAKPDTDIEQRLAADSSRLEREIAAQSQTIELLEEIKTQKNNALPALKHDELVCNVTYTVRNCDDPQKATVAPCPDTIAQLDQLKSKVQIAEEEAATATQNHKAAVDKRTDLESQKDRISDRLTKLGRAKNDIQGRITFATNTLEDAKSDKDLAEKPFLEAQTALETAKTELAKAVAAKIDADQKLREYPKDAATKESEANAAQDEAGKEKTRLEGELANLKVDKEAKEKNWNATSAKVAELQQRKDKKGAVSTGGGNLALIIGPIVAIIVLGAIGVAVFVFVKRRKRRPANENEPKKEAEKEPLMGETREPVDGKVAVPDHSKSSAKADNLAVPPPTGVAVCSDQRQMMIDGLLVSMEDTVCLAMNNDHETTRADQPPNEIEASVLFKDLPPKVLPKARDMIREQIKDVESTKIDVYKDNLVFEKVFGHEQVTFNGHDSKPVYKANVFPFRNSKDTHDTVQEPKHPSPQLPSYAEGLVPPVPGGFMTIRCTSTIPSISKYQEMDRRREEKELRKARRERDRDRNTERNQAGQEELPTARQPVSDPHDITEKTQKSVSGTQQEAGKEDGDAVARIPDDKSMVTGALKEEGKPEIDMSLVETTAREPSCREPLQECTGISGPEPPAAIGGRKRGSRTSQVSDGNGSKKTKVHKKLQGVRKRSGKKSKKSKKKKEKKWWQKAKLDFMNRSRRSTSSSRSSDSSYSVLRELTDRLARDAAAARNTTTTSAASATLPPFTRAELRTLEFFFAGHKMDKSELNEAVTIIYQILDQVAELFFNESRVLETHTPASVVTDIHGNLARLLNILNSYHTPTELAWRYHRFVFTGDYVDRGDNSLQVLLVLFTLKISYPDNMLLLRGNHEDPKCNITYGFFDELDKWFGEEVSDDRGRRMVPSELSNDMKRRISYVYSRMPVAARIDKKIFCCHGTVPDYVGSGLIADINARPHVVDDPTKDYLIGQLMWNDTARGVHGSEQNFGRGGFGRIIGADTIVRVCEANDFSMIVDGHQMMSLGFEGFAGGRVMVVFSSAKYKSDFDNHGATIDFNNGGYAIRKFVEGSRGHKASKKEAQCFHSTHYLGSDIKTSEHNKEMEKLMLEKSKGRGKDAPQVEQADKKIGEPKKANENQVQDGKANKEASQREQVDKSEKPEFTVTMVPTSIEETLII